MSDLVDLIEQGVIERPTDRVRSKKPQCSNCVKNGEQGLSHTARNCPLLGRAPAKPRHERPNITKAERAILEHALAATAPGGTGSVVPRRGQELPYTRLWRRGLLAHLGEGVDVTLANETLPGGDLYKITDAGRVALEAK